MDSSSEESIPQSLSGSQYDAQNLSEEWTIVSDDDNDGVDVDEDNRLSVKESFDENQNDGEVLEVSDDINSCDDNRVNETIESLTETQAKPDSTNNSSDIDVIEEDEDDSSDDELSTASLCSSSVVSQMSNLSFLRDQYLLQSRLLNPDFINEDLSEASSLNYRELNTETELRRGPRAYVHTPNTGLNGKLNLILILSVSTVVGLGIGNFIGWSSHWKQHRHLSLGQVLKLKQLQDELVVCMQNQANRIPFIDGPDSQVCYTDNDYWRGKFETLFSENNGLFDVLQKTQEHYHSKGNIENIISDKECDNKSASDEFHKLRLDFLVNQMEYLKVMKKLEEVKHKGRQSELRVQDLEVENSQLKLKLVEEEEDDEVIVKSWNSRVALLENENQELRTRLEDDEEEDSVVLQRMNDKIEELLTENHELKSAIAQLEAQVVMVGTTPSSLAFSDEYSVARDQESIASSKGGIKLDLLKQRINQMVIENDELKSTIARLRWSYPQTIEETDHSVEEEVTAEDEDEITAEEYLKLEQRLNELKDLLTSEQNESKKWKEMYEQLKTKSDENIENSKNSQNKINDSFDENIIYDWIWNSTNTLKEALMSGSTVVGDRLKEFFNKMNKNESMFSSHVLNGINATKSVIYDLNVRLQEKWQELQDVKAFGFGNENISNKMSKLLEQTLRKLQNAGNKLASKEKNMKIRFEHFSAKVSKLIDNLDNKWNDLLIKLSKGASKGWPQEDTVRSNWFFERANSRREQQTAADSVTSATPKPNTKTTVNSNRIVVESDVEEPDVSSSGGDSGVEDMEDNWFLRKAKKPKLNSNYDFQRHKYRERKARYNGQFGQRFDYGSEHSRQR